MRVRFPPGGQRIKDYGDHLGNIELAPARERLGGIEKVEYISEGAYSLGNMRPVPKL